VLRLLVSFVLPIVAFVPMDIAKVRNDELVDRVGQSLRSVDRVLRERVNRVARHVFEREDLRLVIIPLATRFHREEVKFEANLLSGRKE
jgi:hypothetical protein